MIAAELTREIADAGRGVTRLIRNDPRWADDFDPTAGGFLRSFAGPILALPFIIVVTALLQSAGPEAHAVDTRELWGATIAQILDMIAYPAVLAVLARPLGLGAGYGGFIVVVNWLSLLQALAMAAAGALLPLGGVGLFGFAWLALFALSLFVIWRAASQTLSHEVGPTLLAVVLWVGLGALTDHLGSMVASVLPA